MLDTPPSSLPFSTQLGQPSRVSWVSCGLSGRALSPPKWVPSEGVEPLQNLGKWTGVISPGLQSSVPKTRELVAADGQYCASVSGRIKMAGPIRRGSHPRVSQYSAWSLTPALAALIRGHDFLDTRFGRFRTADQEVMNPFLQWYRGQVRRESLLYFDRLNVSPPLRPQQRPNKLRTM